MDINIDTSYIRTMNHPDIVNSSSLGPVVTMAAQTYQVRIGPSLVCFLDSNMVPVEA